MQNEIICLVENYREEIISFAQKIVQIDSQNPYLAHESSLKNEPIEKKVSQEVFDKLKSHKLSPKFVSKLSERPNVVCEVNSGYNKSLIITGHMDTVPAGDQTKWKYPPLSGLIEDGKLFGIGALDMKGALAAMTYTTIIFSELKLNGNLIFAAVVDEEPGAISEIGAKFLLENGLNADAAINTESGNEKIRLGSKGLYRIKIKSFGKSVHTGFSDWEKKTDGSNAVTNLARLITKLENVKFENSSEILFENRKSVITPSVFSGGQTINIVPNYAEVLVDMRLVPEQNKDFMDNLLEEKISEVKDYDKHAEFQIEEITYIPAYKISPEEKISKILQKSASSILDRKPEFAITGGAGDSHHFVSRGIPCIADFGPSGANAHAIDEYVDIESIIDMTKVYCLTAYEFLDMNN